MSLFKRGPNRMERLLAASRLQEAMERISPQEPPRIYNPVKGTRCHYRDPSQAAARPRCRASGAGWAEGDGGLLLCGLCRDLRAQDSTEGNAA